MDVDPREPRPRERPSGASIISPSIPMDDGLACHSGIAGQSLADANDGATGTLLGSVPSGIVIFSASKGREEAKEQKAKGGLFTLALDQAIAGQRSHFDRNGNGAIEISELYAAVKGDVVRQSDLTQTPWFARNKLVGISVCSDRRSLNTDGYVHVSSIRTSSSGRKWTASLWEIQQKSCRFHHPNFLKRAIEASEYRT